MRQGCDSNDWIYSRKETFFLFSMSQIAVAVCHLVKKSVFETELNEGTRTKNSYNLGNQESATLPCQGDTQRERTKQCAKEIRFRSDGLHGNTYMRR